MILQGRRLGTLRAIDYGKRKETLLPAVMDSFARLESRADIVVVEGAGSPAEINLRAGDIANMGFALPAGVPVLMVGDIDRGGVIASLVGTHAVLEPDERALVKGFLINKFRGELRLFDGGLRAIAERTGWPSLGIAPWFGDAHRLPAEDALDLVGRTVGGNRLVVACPILARIANFDDLDPLAQEPAVDLRFIPPGEPLPVDADVVLLPGSKSTIGDLAFLRAQGWDIDILAHVRRGGHVVGLCGGYQMLGRSVSDPGGLEGPAGGSAAGLGLLDVETILASEKVVTPVVGRHLASGEAIAGYEIHLGRTEGPDCARPLFDLGGRLDGARSADGRIVGSYVHGMFGADGFRRAWLAGFGRVGVLAYEAGIEATLDALADHCERHLDMARIIKIARER